MGLKIGILIKDVLTKVLMGLKFGVFNQRRFNQGPGGAKNWSFNQRRFNQGLMDPKIGVLIKDVLSKACLDTVYICVYT